MNNMLKNKAERMKENMIEFTRDLIKTPSESLNEKKVAGMIESRMKELEYDMVFQDEWGNVVGVIHGHDAAPTVLLNAHMDTVPPNEIQWSHGPYDAKIENDRIIGAGASDCKSGIAAQLYAGAMLKHSLLPLKGNLIVAATVAEENGRSIGVRTLMDHSLPSIGLKPSYAILGEPTGLGLVYGHDGWVNLDIRVEGEQPFHVEDVANGIYRDLEESHPFRLNDNLGEVCSIQPPQFESRSGIRRGVIQMSQKIYQENDVEELLFNVKKNATYAAENYGAVAVMVDVRQEKQQLFTGKTVAVRNVVNAWTTDPFHPLIERSRQTLAAAGLSAKPIKWQLNKLEMGTAGSVLVNEYKIPTVGFGPGLIEQAHAVDECVPLDNIVKAAYGTAAIVHGLIGIPVFGWTSNEI